MGYRIDKKSCYIRSSIINFFPHPLSINSIPNEILYIVLTNLNRLDEWRVLLVDKRFCEIGKEALNPGPNSECIQRAIKANKLEIVRGLVKDRRAEYLKKDSYVLRWSVDHGYIDIVHDLLKNYAALLSSEKSTLLEQTLANSNFRQAVEDNDLSLILSMIENGYVPTAKLINLSRTLKRETCLEIIKKHFIEKPQGPDIRLKFCVFLRLHERAIKLIWKNRFKYTLKLIEELAEEIKEWDVNEENNKTIKALIFLIPKFIAGSPTKEGLEPLLNEYFAPWFHLAEEVYDFTDSYLTFKNDFYLYTCQVLGGNRAFVERFNNH